MRIYPELHSRSLPKFLCMLPVAVAQFSSGRVAKYQGKGGVLGVFFSTDSTFYSVAFGTNAKTTEPIEMPLGMISALGLRNSVMCT